MYTYHDFTIHMELEGIIRIDSLHILQKRLNHHGKAVIRAAVEKEKILELVEQAERGLPARISRREGKRQTLFCGKLKEAPTQRQGGLLVLCLELAGYTRGWAFLQRLASHFSTFLLADSVAEYGRVYFGLPVMDQGTVLEEKQKAAEQKIRSGLFSLFTVAASVALVVATGSYKAVTAAADIAEGLSDLEKGKREGLLLRIRYQAGGGGARGGPLRHDLLPL